MGLTGVVLAAGASERMGRPKALLDFRGRPFAVRILEALEALDVKSRLVVLGPDAARIRPSLATHECIIDRKSTRLNPSHSQISYAVFCLKKKNKPNHNYLPCSRQRRELHPNPF